MTSISRILTLFLISYAVARGILPQELADQLQTDPDAMIAIELGVATVLTLLIAAAWDFLKALPVLVRRLTGQKESTNEKDTPDGTS